MYRPASAARPGAPSPAAPFWAVAGLAPGVRAYVLSLPAGAAAVALLLASRSHVSLHEAVLTSLLIGAAAVSVEASRRLGEPAGTVAKDLLSAWWLPMAVLLPPVYVLVAPLPIMALTQWRVRRTLTYRRVFSAACIGISYAAASAVFHSLRADVSVPRSGAALLYWAVAVCAVGAAAALLNASLIAIAVKAFNAKTQWRTLLADVTNLRLDAVDLSVGVVVAVMVGLNSALLVFLLLPILLLQRGLLHGQLRAVATLDAKTGLLNGPTWEREADSRLLELRRRSQPAAVLLVDIDYFKAVNDAHGHLVGDDVLRAVSSCLQDGLRAGDLLGRFGGEEFVALLPAADVEETALVAERLRANIAALRVTVQGTMLASHVTVSIGAAVDATSALAVHELLAAADANMYRAKAYGRNRVEMGHVGDVLALPETTLRVPQVTWLA